MCDANVDPSTERLIEDVFRNQRRVLLALRGQLGSWADVDLTMAQLRTLVVLVDDGPCSIGHIASALGVSLPNASHLVDRLVRLDLAGRAEDATDRRRILASASAQGVDVLQSLRSGGHDQIRAALVRVDAEDLRALVHGLDALAQSLEDISTSPEDHGTREPKNC